MLLLILLSFLPVLAFLVGMVGDEAARGGPGLAVDEADVSSCDDKLLNALEVTSPLWDSKRLVANTVV